MDKLLDFDSLDKGTPMESLSVPALTRATLARFAGAIDDYNPIYLDDNVAAASGRASVFAPTNLIMGYLGRMVQAWAKGAVLRRFDVKVVRLVWPGDVLTCRGVIHDKREERGECIIEASVWADNQRGENVAKGMVVALVPRERGKTLTKKMRATGLLYHLADDDNVVLVKEKPVKKSAAHVLKKSKVRS